MLSYTFKLIISVIFFSLATFFSFVGYNTLGTSFVVCNDYVYSRSVYVGTNTGNGSGVILNNKYILTAKHVIKDSKRAYIQGPPYKGGHIYGTRILYTSPTNDFALLENRESLTAPAYVTNFNTSPEKLEQGCVVGNPFDDTFVSANPVVIGILPDLDADGQLDTYLIFLGNGTKPGFSGGGIFDKQNRLVGIVNYCRMWGLVCGGEPINKIIGELVEVGKF